MLTIHDMQGKSVGSLIHESICTDIDMEDVSQSKYHAFEKSDPMDVEETEIGEGNYGMDEHRPEHSEMEVDERDIHVNINETRSHHRLPIHHLIFSCIQSALAVVKDTKDQKSRETERVTIMLKLLHQSSDRCKYYCILHKKLIICHHCKVVCNFCHNFLS